MTRTTNTAPVAAAPASAAPRLPSVHVRALITWLAIFPLVTLAFLALGPLTESWHLVLRILLITLIVVPVAVYLVVPRLLGVYMRLTARRR